MDKERIYGELDDKGGIAPGKDTRISALSGKRTDPGDAMITIKGTRFFYRLSSQEFRLFTKGQRDAIEGKAGSDVFFPYEPTLSAEELLSPDAPAFPVMFEADLPAVKRTAETPPVTNSQGQRAAPAPKLTDTDKGA